MLEKPWNSGLARFRLRDNFWTALKKLFERNVDLISKILDVTLSSDWSPLISSSFVFFDIWRYSILNTQWHSPNGPIIVFPEEWCQSASHILWTCTIQWEHQSFAFCGVRAVVRTGTNSCTFLALWCHHGLVPRESARGYCSWGSRPSGARGSAYGKVQGGWVFEKMWTEKNWKFEMP